MLGTPGKPGTLFESFDEVMQLNLEFGAAEQRLDPALEIDSSILQGLFDNATR